MDLTKLTVAVKPRGAWEAVDLGVRMARQWWWPLVRVWLLFSLPLVLVVLLVAGAHMWWLPALVIWWSKPLWERAQLFILSQALFNQMPAAADWRKDFPRFAKRQLLADLTWRRFNPNRSMDLPVSVLEGLNGKRRSERVLLLRRADSQPAGWLTIIGIHVESFLALAAVLLVWALVPENINLDWTEIALASDQGWLPIVQNLLGYAAATLVAPFYVAAGFALYLNRRIHLEGWDIEIAFRRMLQRRHQRLSGHGKVAVLVICGLAMLGLPSHELRAEPSASATETREVTAGPVPAHPDKDAANHAIENILAGEDFEQTQVVRYPKIFGDDEDEGADPDYSLPEGWEDALRWLAQSLEVIFWAVVILLVVWVALRYRHWLEAFGRPKTQRADLPRPQTLFGLDLRPETLPQDVPARVSELWLNQQPREAMALLYRASLVRLIESGLTISASDTEGDCLRKVEAQRPPGQANFFWQLTRNWQKLAYAHQMPADEDIDILCEQWHRVWLAQPEETGRDARGAANG